jgi:hypothetical protein
MSPTVLYTVNYKRSSAFDIDTKNSGQYELQDSNFHKVGVNGKNSER